MVDLNNTTAVLMDSLRQAANETVTNMVMVLPGLLAAIVIFLIGWIVAVIISRLFSGLLKAVRLEDYLKEHKIEDALGTVLISDVLVKILKYYIILIFLTEAVKWVHLGVISSFLTVVLVQAPLLIGAFLVILLAVLLGEYVKEVIVELSKSPLVRFIARATKLVIIYVGVTMALSTIFDTTLISTIFVTVLQALVFGVALAVGIAFGLGGQDEAKDMVKKWRKHLKV
jgi:hypothetical protein